MPSSLDLHKQDNIWSAQSSPFYQLKDNEWHLISWHRSGISVLSLIWTWAAPSQKDARAEERHKHHAPVRGTRVATKRGPTLRCKPDHFSWVTMAPSGKKEKKNNQVMSNWFISHDDHFKRTGHCWFWWALTKPHAFHEPQFWAHADPTNSNEMSVLQQRGVRRGMET